LHDGDTMPFSRRRAAGMPLQGGARLHRARANVMHVLTSELSV
jgi:hypothetical protein